MFQMLTYTEARLHAQSEPTPPIPQRTSSIIPSFCSYQLTDLTAPEIITTAPTMDVTQVQPSKKKSRIRLPKRSKTAADNPQPEEELLSLKVTKNEKKERRKTMSETAPSGTRSRVTFDEPERPATQAGSSPPAYGDEANSTLALPVNRLSESSRSDGSSGDHGVYATTTTTTHTVHTTTTFF